MKQILDVIATSGCWLNTSNTSEGIHGQHQAEPSREQKAARKRHSSAAPSVYCRYPPSPSSGADAPAPRRKLDCCTTQAKAPIQRAMAPGKKHSSCLESDASDRLELGHGSSRYRLRCDGSIG